MRWNYILRVPNSHLKSPLYQSLSKDVSMIPHCRTWFICFTIPNPLLTKGFRWIRDLCFAKTIPAQSLISLLALPSLPLPFSLVLPSHLLLQQIITAMPLSYTWYLLLHNDAAFNSWVLSHGVAPFCIWTLDATGLYDILSFPGDVVFFWLTPA